MSEEIAECFDCGTLYALNGTIVFFNDVNYDWSQECAIVEERNRKQDTNFHLVISTDKIKEDVLMAGVHTDNAVESQSYLESSSFIVFSLTISYLSIRAGDNLHLFQDHKGVTAACSVLRIPEIYLIFH